MSNSRNKISLGIIAVLILANAAVLLIYGFKESSKNHPERPRNVIIDRLQLDADQIVAYDALIDEHRSGIDGEHKEILRLKKELYTSLLEEDRNRKDALTQEIANHIRQIETQHFDHFQDIKDLCRPDQLEAFEALVTDLPKLFAPPKPPHKPKH